MFFLQDTEDSVPLISKLTPEQQKQLELIENMPLVMEHEAKTPEEKERLLGKTLTKLTNKHHNCWSFILSKSPQNRLIIDIDGILY